MLKQPTTVLYLRALDMWPSSAHASISVVERRADRPPKTLMPMAKIASE